MYKPLLVYVYVSLNSQWGVTTHDTSDGPPIGRERHAEG